MYTLHCSVFTVLCPEFCGEISVLAPKGRDFLLKHANSCRKFAGVSLTEFRRSKMPLVCCRPAPADVDSGTQRGSSSAGTFRLRLHGPSVRAAAARLRLQHVRCSTSQSGAATFLTETPPSLPALTHNREKQRVLPRVLVTFIS